MRSPHLGLEAAAAGQGSTTSETREAILSARIDDVPWRASAWVEVTLQAGILAVAGFDERGSGVGFALLADAPTAQRVGETPANAILTIDEYTWSTTGAGGEGTLTLLSLTARRAVGRFAFVATAHGGPGIADRRKVTEGRFDVPL